MPSFECVSHVHTEVIRSDPALDMHARRAREARHLWQLTQAQHTLQATGLRSRSLSRYLSRAVNCSGRRVVAVSHDANTRIIVYFWLLQRAFVAVLDT